MKVLKKVEIRSKEANWIMAQKITKRSTAVNVAIIHLSRIYELCLEQNLYAVITLSKLIEKIQKAKTLMLKLISDFEKLLIDKKIDISSFFIKPLNVYELHASDPVVGDLINIIETFDRLNCLLVIASKSNAFKDSRAKYFRAISKNRGRVYSVLLEILNIDLSKLETVKISHYLGNDNVYLEAAKEMGLVHPAQLYAALNLDVFPRNESAIRNKIIYRLKHME